MQAWFQNVQSALLASALPSTQLWTSIITTSLAACNPEHSAAGWDAEQQASKQNVPQLPEVRKLKVLSATLQLGHALLALPAKPTASLRASAEALTAADMSPEQTASAQAGAAPNDPASAAAEAAAVPVKDSAPAASEEHLLNGQSRSSESSAGESTEVEQALMASMGSLCDLVVAGVRSEFLQQPAISLQEQTVIQVTSPASEHCPTWLTAFCVHSVALHMSSAMTELSPQHKLPRMK